MNESFFEKLRIEKGLIFAVIGAVLVVFAVLFWLFFSYSSKKIEVFSPNGRENWEIGQTYEISWKVRGVDRVGIVLFNGEKPEWIAENIPASQGKYEWTIQPGHEYGPNFWIAVFEYPWRNSSQIDYSAGSFSITYPEMSSCDNLSVEKEWPYFASDLPKIRKVFITEEAFAGNLGGLEGADEKCALSAENQKLEGEWMAFIGGEDPENTALKRLEASPRGLEGIYVEAKPSSELLRGATCHRLLGKNIEEFLIKLSNLETSAKEKLEKPFAEKLTKVWLGRVNSDSPKNCVLIPSLSSSTYYPLAEKYSYTVTCQNWSYGESNVNGYSRENGIDSSFPSCYTSAGKFTYAVGSAGLSLENIGRHCSKKQHLICVEK